MERRNKAHQIRSRKKEESMNRKRGLGGHNCPPYLVAIIPMCGVDASAQDVLETLKNCDPQMTAMTSPSGCLHLSVPRFKQRFAFIVPQTGNIHATMDAVKVANTLMFLYSAEEGMDEEGELLLTVLLAHGLPSTVHVIQGLSKVPAKKRNDARQMVQKFVDFRFPKERAMPLDTDQDAILVLRQIGNQKQRRVTLQERRPHLLAEEVAFEPDPDNDSSGTLKVSGYVRGRQLNANSLVHLPGYGDYQMLRIDSAKDPYPLFTPRSDQMKEEEEVRVLQESNPLLRETLVSVNEVDPMDGEQTWPTEEELMEADAEAASRKILKRVPKGTSPYQAAWIVDQEDNAAKGDSDANDDEEEEDEDDDGSHCTDIADTFNPRLEAVEEEVSDAEDGSDVDQYETVTTTDDVDDYDKKLDLEEETEDLAKFNEARLYNMFPDEVDTPIDVPARVHFQKYRGLKSFRTSPWDPKENLPADYAKIFQFQNFNRSKKRVLSEDGDGVLVGWYITVHIKDFPAKFYESRDPKAPLVLYGLLPHEQKMSVLNLVIRRTAGSSEPIKSKERLIYHVGYRRYAASAIFSEHTNGSKHKFVKFMNVEGATVATMYAPIIFPPAAVVVFKEQADGNHRLVATGYVLSVNPDRIITKRCVLSGHPFKINKRSAIIRFMFFNKEDIEWFKPVELWTKCGRRGHIREAVGTHGHMKCVFDAQLSSQDTVLMNLYKRAFPKWSFEPEIADPKSFFKGETGSLAPNMEYD